MPDFLDRSSTKLAYAQRQAAWLRSGWSGRGEDHARRTGSSKEAQTESTHLRTPFTLPLFAADYDINRHATVLVHTHPTDIASSISLIADDEAREIGATLLLQIDNCVSTSLHRKNEVVGIKGISLPLALTIRRGRRVNVLRDVIGKVELAGDHVGHRRTS